MKELDTRKSLYPPIEIAIKDKAGQRLVFAAKKQTRPVQETLFPLSQRIEGGERGAVYDWVKFLYDLPDEIIDALEAWEIEDIYLYTCREIQKTESERAFQIVDDLRGALDEAEFAAGITKEKPIRQKAKRTTVKNPKRPGG